HGELGWTLGNRTWIDRTAEGWGWSDTGSPDQGRMDLLTVVTHELGHVLGMPQTATGVMQLNLAAGGRLFPRSDLLGEVRVTPSGPAAMPSAPSSSLPAEAPAVTSGLAARPSAVTVLEPVAALAPGSPSPLTGLSPSTRGADIAAALVAARA